MNRPVTARTRRALRLREAVLGLFSDHPHASLEELRQFTPRDWRSSLRWLDGGGMALYLIDRLTACGLDASIDGIGNVYGRDPTPGRKLLTGSHMETQNHAGWLDGVMGVVYGLEAARTLGRGIDVAAWADEEGHFGSFIGSRSFCGLS